MSLTLNEIGAICAGWTYHDPPLRTAHLRHRWTLPDGKRHLTGIEGAMYLPHITPSDPPTDAQIANVQRLVDRAIDANATAFRTGLESQIEWWDCYHTNGINHRRNAALEVLCPEEHREELGRLLEAA